jgi:hypothetical protein
MGCAPVFDDRKTGPVNANSIRFRNENATIFVIAHEPNCRDR